MKKIFTLCAAFAAVLTASAQKESYTAISMEKTDAGVVYTAAKEFADVVADPAKGGVANNLKDGISVVKFGTANIEAEAVGGTVAAGGDDAVTKDGVQKWADIKWDWKNQGDISYAYIQGTGNPVFGYEIEEIMTEGEPTGKYRQNFAGYYYTPDCGKTPVQGLYYKFTAKTDGVIKIAIWSNKGNRNTYLVDGETTKPVAYDAEGYINGQNGADGQKKWLTPAEIKTIHDAAKVNAETGVDSQPYCIGAGNQNYWGCINYVMKAGQTIWLFQDSSQVGFRGYDFTPGATEIVPGDITAVEGVVVDEHVNGNAAIYNLAGQQVSKSFKGVVIKNGKKYIQ